jgi:hypothetical protein
MIKSLQVVLALLVPSVLLVAPVRADGDQDKSPEDVFKGFAAAIKKDDVKAVMSHVTHDSQSHIAGTTWLTALLDKSFTGMTFFNSKPTRKEKEHIAAIDEVLKRHGLSEDAVLKKLEKDNGEPITLEDLQRQLVPVVQLVKDKPAFVTEMLKVRTDRLETAAGVKEIGEAKVKEVKIDGKQAKSQVTFPGAYGKESTGTIYFKLESGVWKIDFIETERNWPLPPPPPQVQPPAPQVQRPATHYDSRPGLLRRLFPCLRR